MTLELPIDRLDEHGAGVGAVEGPRGRLEVHVAGALPGETVRARLVHTSPHRPAAWAELEAVLVPSPARRAAPCARFGVCGGCTLLHLDEAAQRAAKRRRVAEALLASGLGGVPVAEVVPSPRALGYRAFGKYVVFRGADGALRLGSYAPRSHTPVDMAGCAVVEPAIERAAAATAQLVGARSLDLRYVLVRATEDGSLLCSWIVPAPLAPPALEALASLARSLAEAVPGVAGVVLHVNERPGDALWDPRRTDDRVLHGAGAVWEQVGAVRLRLSARAFFQVNRAQAEQLYGAVAALLEPRPGELVADLYAGVGGIALTLAAQGLSARGVEVAAEAVADATASAAQGALPARFARADASEVARAHQLERADHVVLNPPRKGCSPAALQAAVGLRPRRLVYVSCQPETLARDLAWLARAGYVLRRVQPYDLFPQTAHVETLCLLAPG